jgi:SAM-dependent methyltransferase
MVDIGCGRGTTTLRLARWQPAAQLVALDQSPTLLAVAGARLREHGHRVLLACADFHYLPLANASVDLAVAAFCLYHSSHPEQAVAEIGRCLTPGGRAILVTKSADSYRDIDHLLAGTGLDPDATGRPSLYRTFHSGNAEHATTAAGLTMTCRLDQRHVFRFTTFDHLATYAVTCPKYQLPPTLAADPSQLAAALRAHLPEQPVITSSTVTYLVVALP